MPRISNIHQPAELRNLALNGAFDFFQEKAGNTTTINTASSITTRPVDMWATDSAGATTKNYSIVRSTDVPTLAQAGFQAPYSLLYTQITGIPSFAAGDYIFPSNYRMEGADYARIHSKQVTFGFWVKASTAGTYSFALVNGTTTRSYVTTFPVNSANTWEFKSITVTMDSSGTWAFDNSLGLLVYIGNVTGSTYSTATVNQWQAGFLNAATGATNWMATSGATLRITLFSIVEGTLGFGATGFQRAGKTIQQELAICQRYYEKSYLVDVAPGTAAPNGAFTYRQDVSGAGTGASCKMAVNKRSAPTITTYSPAVGTSGTCDSGGYSNSGNAQGYTPSAIGVSLFGGGPNTSMTGTGFFTYHWVADSRL